MNHPNREDFVPYLFGEGTAEKRRQLREHLSACPQCRAEVQSWQSSLRQLDSWRLPSFPRTAMPRSPMLRWAFAGLALLALVSAFLLGRLTLHHTADAELQAQLARRLRPELSAELRQLVHEEIARAGQDILATSREQARMLLTDYARSVNARLEGERVERIADCLSLKKDVDTIAVNADAGLRDTEQRLTQMVVYQHSPTLPNPLIDSPAHHE